MLDRIRRFVTCDLLDIHVGHIETASFETESEKLVIMYMPCVRCGLRQPLEIRTLDEVRQQLGLEGPDG